MISVVAAVNLPRLPRGATVLVDETDARVKGMIRGGYLIPERVDVAPPKQERGDQ